MTHAPWATARSCPTFSPFNTEFSGNDFALDDFSVTAQPVPEPATVMLLMIGLGAIIRTVRPRRT